MWPDIGHELKSVVEDSLDDLRAWNGKCLSLGQQLRNPKRRATPAPVIFGGPVPETLVPKAFAFFDNLKHSDE